MLTATSSTRPGCQQSTQDLMSQRAQELREQLFAIEQLQAFKAHSSEVNYSPALSRQTSPWRTPQTPTGLHSPFPARHPNVSSSGFSTDLRTPTSSRVSTRSEQFAMDPNLIHASPTLQHGYAAALYHARSSPELGYTFKSPAKLLWADRDGCIR